MTEKRPAPVVCRECGRSFGSTLGRVQAGKDKFCSRECYRAPNAIRLEGGLAYVALTSKDRRLVAEAVIDITDVKKVRELGRRWSPSWVRSVKQYKANAVSASGEKVTLHRFLLDAPPELDVDHVNGDILDCRRANMRLVTQGQNNQNVQGANVRSASGIRGVSWDSRSKKWRAQVGVNNRVITVGRFDRLEDAEQAAVEARRKYMTHSRL